MAGSFSWKGTITVTIRVTLEELLELIWNLPEDQILEIEFGGEDICRN